MILELIPIYGQGHSKVKCLKWFFFNSLSYCSSYRLVTSWSGTQGPFSAYLHFFPLVFPCIPPYMCLSLHSSVSTVWNFKDEWLNVCRIYMELSSLPVNELIRFWNRSKQDQMSQMCVSKSNVSNVSERLADGKKGIDTSLKKD